MTAHVLRLAATIGLAKLGLATLLLAIPATAPAGARFATVVHGGQTLVLGDGIREGGIRVQDGGTLRVLPGVPQRPLIDGVEVGTGGSVVFAGGLVTDSVRNVGGRIDFSGGAINTIDNLAGVIDYSGGQASTVVIGDSLFAGSFPGEAVLNVYSGWTQLDLFGTGILLVGSDGIVNLFGGSLFDAFDTIAFEDSAELNITGAGFAIDGVPIPGLTTGESVSINEREVTLSGFLADGSPFSFFLSATGATDVGTVEAFPQAVVTLTSTIPEPHASLLVAFVAVGTVFTHARGKMPR